MSPQIDRWLSLISAHAMTIVALWQTVATIPPSWSIPSTPQWQTISRSTSMMNRFTHSTHDEPFHPCYKWQTISSILLMTNHCTNVLVTNQQAHPFHGKSLQSCHHHKPFQPSHLWQTISPFHVWQTISPKLPMTNHFAFAIHEKLFLPITNMKKNNIRPMMSPWETIAIMPQPEILSPIQSMINHFTHSTKLQNYGKLLHPCYSWQFHMFHSW